MDDDPLRTLDKAGIDLGNLPFEYLEQYPYPALALIFGVPVFGEVHGSQWSLQNIQPLSPVWTNSCWRRFTGNRLSLLQCITSSSARRLSLWLTGQTDSVPFMSPKSLNSRSGSIDSTRSPGEDQVDTTGPTLTLEFKFAPNFKVKLLLAKTVQPVYRISEDGVRRIVRTHEVAVITSMPSGQIRLQMPAAPRRLSLRTTGGAAYESIPEDDQLDAAPTPSTTDTVPLTSLSSDSTPGSLLSHPSSGGPSQCGFPSLGANANGLLTPSPTTAQRLSRSSSQASGRTSEEDLRPSSREASSSMSSDGAKPQSLPNWRSGDTIELLPDGSARPLRSAAVYGDSADREKDDPPEGSRSNDVEQLLKTTNWAETPLGKKSQWPVSLQLMVAIIMRWPTPLAVWWGPDLVFIYNQKYADRLHNHPRAFGQSGTVSWAELWPHLGQWTETALNGTPVVKDNDLTLHPNRGSDTWRESYQQHTWTPVSDGAGHKALVHSWRDTTRDVIVGRHDRFLTELALRSDQAHSRSQHERLLIDAFEHNPTEVPFALIYRVESEPLFDTQEHKVTLKYAGGVGVPKGHASAPALVELRLAKDGSERSESPQPMIRGEDGFRPVSPVPRDLPEANNEPWPFVEALQTHRPVFVQDCFSRVEGFPLRQWEELPSSAVVIPICRTTDTGVPRGIMVVGISSVNAYDDDYSVFVDDLHMLLTNSLGAVLEKETQRVLQAEIAAAERTREVFLMNVSHKLLSPLSLISGQLEDLGAETVTPVVGNGLQLIKHNVSRLTRLVTMLVADSALEGGRSTTRFGRVNLGQLTQNVAALFVPAATAAETRLDVECDEASQPVFVDVDKYERVLFVLLGNAIKFAPGGRVALRLEYTATTVVVTVVDDGSGIQPAVLAEIASATLDDDGTHELRDGTGIGLSHAYKLVRLHHGTLSVKSRDTDDTGTTFTLTLPLGSAHLPSEDIDIAATEKTGMEQVHQALLESLISNKQPPQHELDPSPPTGTTLIVENEFKSETGVPYFNRSDVVMIVDNDASSRDYLVAIFSVLCEVVTATDGAEALAKVKERPPNLIIADASLPSMDGFALTRTLKSGTREEQKIPVILLTSRPDGQESVADDFLKKPYHSRELITRARMQIQWGRKLQALEEAFLERTAELRTFQENVPVGMFRTTADSWVVYVNKRWHQMSGYPMGEAVINWGDYVRPEDAERVRLDWHAFAGSDDEVLEFEFTWRTGTTNLIIAAKLPPVRGVPAGILGCCIDITDRVQKDALQKERLIESEQRRIEAVESKRQQEELIDITSHEMRNPISSLMQISIESGCSSLVKSNLEAMQRELKAAGQSGAGLLPTPERMAALTEDLEALDGIYQCALTQERVSNDVLSLGKIQMNTLEIRESEYAVRGEVNRLFATFQSEARANQLDLQLELGTSFDRLHIHSVYLDPVRFGQVLTNLVSNAVRFTSTSPLRRVRLVLDIGFRAPQAPGCAKPEGTDEPLGPVSERTPLYLFGTVSDTGPGLTPADTEALFQRFTRQGSDNQTVFGGIGLGLFVCRKLTELMGGRIDVETVYGQGTTFNFFIQVRPRLNRPKLPSKSPSKTTKLQCKARVLVVEDNVINSKVLCRQLSIAGATVQSVVNGLEAWRLLSERQAHGSPEHFDCVFMDLEMPVMDGYMATRKVREAEAANVLDRTVVVALTGNARQAQIESAMADFDAVIVKPYRLDRLLRVIEVSVGIGSDVPGDRVRSVAGSVGQSAE